MNEQGKLIYNICLTLEKCLVIVIPDKTKLKFVLRNLIKKEKKK